MTIRSQLDDALSARLTSVTPLRGVRAGSALLTVGERLLVVGDDAEAVAWVDPATGISVVQPLDGLGEPLPKMLKPDFESAAQATDGSVWIFGSGSLDNRRGVVRLSGSGHDVVERYDATVLYDALEAHLGTAPNIEGALFVDDRLLLCHRGVAERPDVLLELEWATALRGPLQILRSRTIEPPTVAGIRAHVTDVTAIPGVGLALLAAAEDTSDAIADGPVAGALIGILDEDMAHWTPVLDMDGLPTVRKPEGLVVGVDAASGWLVTDRDDPDLAAELCRFELTAHH